MAGSGYLSLPDGRIEYRWNPPATDGSNDVALVLLHEGLGCVALWRNFPVELAKATGFGVFTYSRIGYGSSDPCSLPRSLTYMHHEGQEVLPRVLSHISADHIILIGHSDGASIAAIHAGSIPDPRLRGIVLMAPHIFAEQVSISAITDAKLAYETGKLRDGLERYHGDNVDCAFWGWNGAWLDPAFVQWDLSEFLPRIKVPVLFIQGREDQYGSLAQLDALNRGLPSRPISLVLDACRHSPHLDQPVQTQDAITGFIHGILSKWRIAAATI